MTNAAVAAIVLAAGSSTRLGRPKQLLPIGQTPLLSRTLDVVRLSSLAPRILVIGGYADYILAQVDTRGFEVVINSEHTTGMGSSLQAAIQRLPPDIAAVAVVLGDQPLLPPWLLDELTDAFDQSAHAGVRPRYDDGPGNPVVLGRALFAELLQLEGDVGARDVIRRHASRFLDLPVPGRDAPRDVDTLADFEALLLDWSSTGAPDVPRYCLRCATPVVFRENHGRLRPVCPSCGFVYYFDPKVATAVVVEIDGQVVLQRRAIDPGMGMWTFPGGFVDRGESVAEAARREVLEEVGLVVENVQLLGVYSEPGETVILVAYHAGAAGQQPRIADDESTAVALFDPAALPELAFPRNTRVIADWLQLTRR